MSNSTRDQEITRRRLAGEAPGDLAREFDISRSASGRSSRPPSGSSAASRPSSAGGHLRSPSVPACGRGCACGLRSPGSQWWECVGAAG